jgi:hypothetical protein
MPAQAYTEHVISLVPGDERAPDQREVAPS